VPWKRQPLNASLGNTNACVRGRGERATAEIVKGFLAVCFYLFKKSIIITFQHTPSTSKQENK
jgi:hypothetical protein